MLLQIAFLLLLGAAAAATGGKPPEAGFFLFLLLWGAVGGSFFVSGSLIWAPDAGPASRGYAWDLLGSFAGAVVLSAVLLPLAGLIHIFGFLIALNILVLLLIGTHPRAHSG
jgi:hypothetical protein